MFDFSCQDMKKKKEDKALARVEMQDEAAAVASGIDTLADDMEKLQTIE